MIKYDLNKLKLLLPDKMDSDSSFLHYLLGYLEYFITGIYFIISIGDVNRIKQFTLNRNPVHKLRINLHKKKEFENIDKFNKRFLKNGRYDFNGIYLPDISGDYSYIKAIKYIYNDIFKIYTEYDDNYNWKLVDKVDKRIPEGVYCYSGPNGEDINIKPGYTVIDAGAWIGDFSAYAAKKGAHLYAFEPMPKTIEYLKMTAKYNGNITVVPFGLGDKPSILRFLENANDSGSSMFDDSGELEMNVTTIDDWVEQNNIKKVDFIKSDIEGFERNMLAGAKKVLKTHCPILSICAYHFPDDPQVLEGLILDANPDYNIIHRKMKLFAYVLKRG